MKKILKHLLKYIYNKYRFRGKGVILPYSADVSIGSEIEGDCVFYKHASFHGKLGRGTIISSGPHLAADVGRYCSIGSVQCIVARHPMKAPYVTTSPCFYSLKKQLGYTYAKEQSFKEFKYFDETREIAVKIGNDCWVGPEVCLIGGIEIGDGAVVLSRAFVTKDVPPYAIVGGIPAKVIGYRYDEETIKLLQKVQWWNLPVEWLKEHSDLLCDMDKFKEHFSHPHLKQ